MAWGLACAVRAEITTGLDTQEGEGRDRPMQKAKMEIILTKSPQFDELMAGTTSQQPGQQAQRQQQQPRGSSGSGSGAPGGPSQPSSSEDAAAGAGPSETGASSQPQVCRKPPSSVQDWKACYRVSPQPSSACAPRPRMQLSMPLREPLPWPCSCMMRCARMVA